MDSTTYAIQQKTSYGSIQDPENHIQNRISTIIQKHILDNYILKHCDPEDISIEPQGNDRYDLWIHGDLIKTYMVSYNLRKNKVVIRERTLNDSLSDIWKSICEALNNRAHIPGVDPL